MVKKKTNEEEVEKKTTKKKDSFDIESLKEELNDYIDERIRKDINNEIEKSYKRTIREKNKKIIIKNMIITTLLLVIVYLVYLLNDADYFDKFFVEENNNEKISEVANKEDNTVNEEETKEKEPTLDELKKEYAGLLDNIYVNENSKYVNDYYNGKLTGELKNYLTLNFLDINSLTRENNYNIIDSEIFKQCYENVFTDDYLSQNFNYNDNLVRYINVIDSYITDDILTKNSTNIKRVITDIKLSDDEIIITTSEGLVKDNKIYNIISLEEISEYSDKLLIENASKLNRVVYTFNRDNKLLKIEK